MFVDRALRSWGRALSPARTERILASPLSGSPLFLKTLLDELRVASVENELNARLDDYLAAHDIPDLLGRVLQRLEGDCGDDFVSAAISLIWASRAGLEESEIITITGAAPLAWASLRNGLGDALRDPAGRIAFSHDFLRQAVEARYLETDDAQRTAHLVIADHFEQLEPGARQAEELPYQLGSAQAWDRLAALLTDLDRFELLRTRGDGELLSWWMPLIERALDPEQLLCSAIEARTGETSDWSPKEVDLALELTAFLRFAGRMGAAHELISEKIVSVCERILGPEHPCTLVALNNLALVLKGRGDFKGALEAQAKATEAIGRGTGYYHVAAITALNNLALALHAVGDYKGKHPPRTVLLS